MGREHRILSGLQASAVPGPSGQGLLRRPRRERRAVLRDGLRRRPRPPRPRDRRAGPHACGPEQRQPLARRHDGGDPRRRPRAVGLADLGRHEGYIERQLKRWYGQWNQGKTRELARRRPGARRACSPASPSRARPPSSTATTGSTTAWSTTTATSSRCSTGRSARSAIRSPTSGCSRCTGTGPNDADGAWSGTATTAPGFWDRTQLAERYAEVSGRDISQLDFYVAFAFWKLACIIEGVYSRYLGGALGDRPPEELAPVQAAGRTGRGHRRALSGRAAVTDGRQDVDGVYQWLVAEPILHEPVLVVMLTGWIDAAGAGAAAADAFSKECETSPLVTLRRRHVHRLPRPPPDHGTARRRQHRSRLVDDRAAIRAGPTSGRDVLVLTGPEPDMAWHRFAAAVARHLGRARRHQDGRLRRLPVRGPAHPHAAAVVLVAVDRGAGERVVRPELGRRPGRHGRGARARTARPQDPGARHLGAGAALRRRDALSRCVGRAARRADRGHRHRGRRRRPARRASARSASGSTSSIDGNARAPGDAAPARGDARRHRPTARSIPVRRSRCAPATNSPTRSSSSSATRTEPVVPALRGRVRDDRWSTVGSMKVDGNIGLDLRNVAANAKEVEAAGYSGAWTAETSHDPFLPLLLAAEHTEQLELGTSIAVAFARNPMTLANIGVGPAGATPGPLHPRPRQPDQAAHHQAVLDGVEPPGAAHARDDPGHPGHLGHVADRHEARLPRRLLHPHADDAVLHPDRDATSTGSARRRSSSPASAS